MGELTTSFQDQQPEQETALSGLYLVRFYRVDNPFQTLSDLPIDQAQTIMEAANPQVAPDNMQMRHNIEDWMRETVQREGVTQERQNPIYFAIERDLGQFDDILNRGASMEVYALDNVDLSGWTFTLDDSSASAPPEVLKTQRPVETPEHDLHGSVMTQNALKEYLEKEGFPNEVIGGKARYFEAQMWTNEPNIINPIEKLAASFTPPHQPSLLRQ